MNGNVVILVKTEAVSHVFIRDARKRGVGNKSRLFQRFEALLEAFVRDERQDAAVERRPANEPDNFGVFRFDRRRNAVDDLFINVPVGVGRGRVNRFDETSAERLPVRRFRGEGEDIVEVADRRVDRFRDAVRVDVVRRLETFQVDSDVADGERIPAVSGGRGRRDAVERAAHPFDVTEEPFVAAGVARRGERYRRRFEVGGQAVFRVAQRVRHFHRTHRFVHRAADIAENAGDRVHQRQRQRDRRQNFEKRKTAARRQGVRSAGK